MHRIACLLVVAGSLGACRIGFDERAPEDSEAGEVVAVPGTDLSTSCAPGTTCLVDCSQATACSVECNGAAVCDVMCPPTGCLVRSCYEPGCEVSCAMGAPIRLTPSLVTCQ